MVTQKKKHNTAFTSRLSWRECINEGLPIKEKHLVLKYLSAQPLPRTSRQISNDLHKERTNITKTLNELVNSELVEVIKHGKCQTTGRKVGYYSVVKQDN